MQQENDSLKLSSARAVEERDFKEEEGEVYLVKRNVLHWRWFPVATTVDGGVCDAVHGGG